MSQEVGAKSVGSAWAKTPEVMEERPGWLLLPRSDVEAVRVVILRLRGKRKYALYVRDTQERADDSVGNIAAKLQTPSVERFYPQHARRAVSKYGASRGWRRNRLRTAGGFTVDAIGLDTAARGVKIEDQRPDLIIFDDLDGKLDTPATTQRKIATLTTSLLPAGASNVAALGIQNLIIPDGIFARLADGRADYLARRIVSGPFPAIYGLKTEFQEDPVSGTRRAVIVDGDPSWTGQDLATCQKNIDDWGLAAFLKEAQHEVQGRKEGRALNYAAHHTQPVSFEECKRLVGLGRVFGGIDFGLWRFAFTLWAVDEFGVPVRIDEYFSQRQNHTQRAGAVHALCAKYGIRHLLIWGDAANPQDILEINTAWSRSGSRLRVSAVEMENKIRATSVDRLNRLLETDAIRFRALPPEEYRWMLGMNAASAGTEMSGSRLEWEMQHWSYPIPQEGKAQGQDPDDHTADGADMIASMRYAIMSWWKAPNLPKPEVDPFAPEVTAANGLQTLRSVRRQMERRSELLRRRQAGFY